jgi:hypothetical protein
VGGTSRAEACAGRDEVLSSTSYAGREQAPTLSRDGEQIAFSWNCEKEDNYDIYGTFVMPPNRHHIYTFLT